MDLNGKVVVVTGAARGLGAAMARALAERGAQLVLVDLDADALDATATACEAAGARTVRHAANVADERDVVALFEQVADEFGALHGLINNAGILRDGLLVKARDGEVTGRLSLAHWQAVIDVNLTGVFLCGREAAARMITGGDGGVIVNVSSISRAGNVGQSNYSAAKAGVAALTVTWAKELARHGIRVAAIAPGFIDTEMVANMKADIRDRLVASVPLGRIGRPEQIAHTAVYLFENDFISGRVIEVDGGQRL